MHLEYNNPLQKYSRGWAVLIWTSSRGWEQSCFPCPWQLHNCFQFGASKLKPAFDKLDQVQGQPLKWGGAWKYGRWGDVEGAGFVQFSKEKAKAGFIAVFNSIMGHSKGNRARLLEHTMKGWETSDTSLGEEYSKYILGKTFSQWECFSTVTDCPEWMWSLHSWVSTKLNWIRAWETSSSLEVSLALSKMLTR